MALLGFILGCAIDAAWQIVRGALLAMGAVWYLRYIGVL